MLCFFNLPWTCWQILCCKRWDVRLIYRLSHRYVHWCAAGCKSFWIVGIRDIVKNTCSRAQPWSVVMDITRFVTRVSHIDEHAVKISVWYVHTRICMKWRRCRQPVVHNAVRRNTIHDEQIYWYSEVAVIWYFTTIGLLILRHSGIVLYSYINDFQPLSIH